MVIIDNCDASFAASHIIRQIVNRPEVDVHLSGEEEMMEMTQPGPGTNLPFGRRPIAFFDDNASSAFTSQARGLVKELISKSQGEEGDDHHLPDLRDLTPLFETEISLASSLLLECLTAVKKESLKGMGGAYDMLVTAGSLLLQEAVTPITAVKAVEKAIISNVTKKGAEAILGMAEIRDMCGSLRYKFRFVERVAPALIRPPNAALWCVRHQCDMRAIVLVAEIMLDNAKVFFRDGWEERKRAMGGEEVKEEEKEAFSPTPPLPTTSSDSYPNPQFVSSPNSPRSPRPPLNSNSPYHHGTTQHNLSPDEIRDLDDVIKRSIENVLGGNVTDEWDGEVERENASSTQHVPLSPRLSTSAPLASPSKSSGTPPRSPIDLISPPSSPRTSTDDPQTTLSTSARASPSHSGTLSSNFPKYTRFGRRRMITACRALRSQINSFEESFRAVNGHNPKGIEERKPFASTYATYREWKKGLRNDAGIRVQALVRGWLVRVKVEGRLGGRGKEETKRVTRVESSQEEKEVGYTHNKNRKAHEEKENGGGGRTSGEIALMGKVGLQTVDANSNWEGSTRIEKVGKGESKEEYSGLSTGALIEKKRALKTQLKSYDINFMRENGRMPVKAEKEPIRHLYEDYNKVKDMIARAEEGKGGEGKGEKDEGRMGVEVPESTDMEGGNKERERVGLSSNNLHKLKVEKASLHQKLRSYEKEFVKKEGRQVSSFQDIKPVAGLYRRYKEIKKLISGGGVGGM